MDRWRGRFWTLLAIVVGVPLLIGIVLAMRFLPDRPVTYASIEDHFKYGSTGGERNAGFPLSMWKALPVVFADKLPKNVWYTVAWAVVATGLVILGFVIRWLAARGAALALLVGAVFKAFLFDVPHLGGVYLAASLFGLGASLVVVGITLQRFTAGRDAAGTPAG